MRKIGDVPDAADAILASAAQDSRQLEVLFNSASSSPSASQRGYEDVGDIELGLASPPLSQDGSSAGADSADFVIGRPALEKKVSSAKDGKKSSVVNKGGTGSVKMSFRPQAARARPPGGAGAAAPTGAAAPFGAPSTSTSASRSPAANTQKQGKAIVLSDAELLAAEKALFGDGDFGAGVPASAGGSGRTREQSPTGTGRTRNKNDVGLVMSDAELLAAEKLLFKNENFGSSGEELKREKQGLMQKQNGGLRGLRTSKKLTLGKLPTRTGDHVHGGVWEGG